MEWSFTMNFHLDCFFLLVLWHNHYRGFSGAASQFSYWQLIFVLTKTPVFVNRHNRSVVARQRYKSLDGGCRELKILCEEQQWWENSQKMLWWPGECWLLRKTDFCRSPSTKEGENNSSWNISNVFYLYWNVFSPFFCFRFLFFVDYLRLQKEIFGLNSNHLAITNETFLPKQHSNQRLPHQCSQIKMHK